MVRSKRRAKNSKRSQHAYQKSFRKKSSDRRVRHSNTKYRAAPFAAAALVMPFFKEALKKPKAATELAKGAADAYSSFLSSRSSR